MSVCCWIHARQKIWETTQRPGTCCFPELPEEADAIGEAIKPLLMR